MNCRDFKMRSSPWPYRYADEILNSKLALKKEIEHNKIDPGSADAYSRSGMT